MVTLVDMFQDLPESITAPLSMTQFLIHVLAPEVGMRLIIDDRRLDIASTFDRIAARSLMEASSAFGQEQFPVGDDDTITAGDEVMQTMAKKRRGELQLEEKYAQLLANRRYREEEGKKEHTETFLQEQGGTGWWCFRLSPGPRPA